MPVTFSPAGGFSTTDTCEPSVAPTPAFVTVTVYWSPVSPCVQSPAWVLVITRSGGAGSKSAVTERAWSSVTWQVVRAPEQSPDHPANTEPALGAAVSVTIVPAG